MEDRMTLCNMVVEAGGKNGGLVCGAAPVGLIQAQNKRVQQVALCNMVVEAGGKNGEQMLELLEPSRRQSGHVASGGI